MKRCLKDECGKASLLMQWQTWIALGLIVALVYVIVVQPFKEEGGMGFKLYLITEDGKEIIVKPDVTYSLIWNPNALKMYSGTQAISKMELRLWVKPTWDGIIEPANPNATIKFISAKSNWITYPAGANLNQVGPTWWEFDSFPAPLNVETKKGYGAAFDAWNFGIGPQPSGAYGVECSMTVSASYSGQTVEKTAKAQLAVTWSADVLSLLVGYESIVTPLKIV